MFEIQDGSPEDFTAGSDLANGLGSEEALVELKLQDGEISASLGNERSGRGQLDPPLPPRTSLCNQPGQEGGTTQLRTQSQQCLAPVFCRFHMPCDGSASPGDWCC